MSLKGFHILFICLAILLAIGCSGWAYANEVPGLFGPLSAVTAVALTVYGIFFIIKSRKLIL